MKYQSKYEEMTACDVTREALKAFKNSNTFIENMDMQWEELFNKPIGSRLRIKLPSDYICIDNNKLLIEPTISLQEACIVGTVAVLLKNPVMSRRFWDS